MSISTPPTAACRSGKLRHGMTEAKVSARPRDRIDTSPRFSEGDAIRLNRMFRGADTREMLASVFEDNLAGDVAVVSSFGAESAVLLHLIAQRRSVGAGAVPRDRQAFPRDAGLSRRAGRAARPDQLAASSRRMPRNWPRRTRTACAGPTIPMAAARSARSSRWPKRWPVSMPSITGRKAFQAEHARATCRASRSTPRTRRAGSRSIR